MALIEPLGGLLGLEPHIVLAGADLDLDFLGLRDFGLGACGPLFLLQLVLKLTIIHHFRNRRLGVRGDLDKVKAGRLGRLQGVTKGQNAEVLPCGADDTEFRCADLPIYPYFIGRSYARTVPCGRPANKEIRRL
jgi:hypothetical protein